MSLPSFNKLTLGMDHLIDLPIELVCQILDKLDIYDIFKLYRLYKDNKEMIASMTACITHVNIASKNVKQDTPEGHKTVTYDEYKLIFGFVQEKLTNLKTYDLYLDYGSKDDIKAYTRNKKQIEKTIKIKDKEEKKRAREILYKEKEELLKAGFSLVDDISMIIFDPRLHNYYINITSGVPTLEKQKLLPIFLTKCQANHKKYGIHFDNNINYVCYYKEGIFRNHIKDDSPEVTVKFLFELEIHTLVEPNPEYAAIPVTIIYTPSDLFKTLEINVESHGGTITAIIDGPNVYIPARGFSNPGNVFPNVVMFESYIDPLLLETFHHIFPNVKKYYLRGNTAEEEIEKFRKRHGSGYEFVTYVRQIGRPSSIMLRSTNM